MYNTETIERFIDLAPKNDLRTQTKAAWGSNIFWLLISSYRIWGGRRSFCIRNYNNMLRAVCLGFFSDKAKR